ncbi:4-hydroxy-3-methylbut-2-enyl diphosphate reductase [Varunaivibrio sulfuroxidans]|uniref:4-hydroxy-3-methylbut-2-enyl diphosphate reductase n=1 Tax=Varunaivibrio sulfuroxidans TaxID=1773489 RepID=A0A4R3J636_9PROT|nr:4-hydroxy-3-methylbut-2-enyl diphosphate reductase [Varunaivibrio sulfuroxidans]TCS61359.1 4-hydroxy-3-methylbut-2-enyl diphosphate reductase [Varunaivibrio sulfuroxidans]WES31029.1 4-hydroxy-3-methylbut-2-enyl diphosphate reductase [Varunaivibrio sulfuroxidans]
MKPALHVILAQPRGFCAGVERAIAIVEKSLEKYGAPVYVRHEIVHNKHVVERLRAKGAIFVDELDQIPDGARTVFSAHGVAQAVEDEARARALPYIDATCPLVTKVHHEGRNHVERHGREIILIGHQGHPEVEGTQGRIPGGTHIVATAEDVARLRVRDPQALAFVTQTTLSVDDTRDIIDALRRRFPKIIGPGLNDICYATQNRQSAARQLAEQCDLVLVIGGKNSSNSNRLREIAQESGTKSHLIDDRRAFDPAWLRGVRTLGITAGASAPEDLVSQLVDCLGEHARLDVTTLNGAREDMHFNLPKSLQSA